MHPFFFYRCFFWGIFSPIKHATNQLAGQHGAVTAHNTDTNIYTYSCTVTLTEQAHTDTRTYTTDRKSLAAYEGQKTSQTTESKIPLYHCAKKSATKVNSVN